MKRAATPFVLAALTVLGLALQGVSCNRVGSDSGISDALILLTAVSYTGTSVADATTDVTATLVFDVKSRSNSIVMPPDPTLNAVTFKTVTLVYDPPFTAQSGSGPASSVAFPVGSSGNKVILSILPEPTKASSAPGTVVSLTARLDGEDMLGRSVSLETHLGVSLIP